MKTKSSFTRKLFATALIFALGANLVNAAEYEGEAHVGLNFLGGSVGISNGVRLNPNNSLTIDTELGSSFLLLISTDWFAAYANYQHKFGKNENRGFFLNAGPGFAYASYETEVLDALFKKETEKTWQGVLSAKAGCGYKFAVGKEKKHSLSFSLQNNLFFHGSDAGVYWVPSIQTSFSW